ncbi:CDP-alcohol phosphatidyltransferase family protein [Indioceanicola profundi]|uniref:CDP-alcohol phosphatidyltransferase family protein n=1 Tax=Indioceanicola profundi TaxID=2220096 RepID=UPI001CED5884|nr:CDP-alcohol phosphatidyltransferase family protein [Indioceanicola profundi]
MRILVVNLPNIITVARLLAVPLLVWLILNGRLGAAFWLFVACGVSDALDGFIARSFRARTKIGGYLDPIADKTLLVGSFIALGIVGIVPMWLVVLAVARDIIIVAGVSYLTLRRERLAMQPLWISKVNTFLQIALVALELAVHGAGVGLAPYVVPLEYVVAATTAWSLVGYITRGIIILRSPGEGRDVPRAGEKT